MDQVYTLSWKSPYIVHYLQSSTEARHFLKVLDQEEKKLGFSFLNWGQDDKIGLKMLIIPSFFCVFRDKISNFANGNPQNYF